MTIYQSVERLRELFDYDPITGILTIREWRGGGCRRLGDRATFLHKSSGYLAVKIGGRHLKAHRVILAMVTGEWPKDFVDHINRDPTDNRLSNLRLCSRSENARNRVGGRRQERYSGLPRGVYPICGNFKAQICVDRRLLYLGVFQTPEEASAAYDAAALKHHGQFALTNAALAA